MAIFHCQLQIIKRSAGRSVVEAAAYRSGEKLRNEWTGFLHDYSRKRGIVHTEVMLPSHAPPEFANRSALWNSVEQIEKSSDAQLAREIEAALPVELSREEQLRLVCAYVKDNFVDKGMCADFAIHDSGNGNPHVHILLTIRPLNKDGSWGAKCRKVYELDENGNRIPNGRGRWKSHREDTTDWNNKENCERWRAAWAEYANAALERTGRPERIDHRSYARQGVDQIPTIHMGVAALRMEKRGIVTDRGNINREIAANNRLLKELKARITRLYNWSKAQCERTDLDDDLLEQMWKLRVELKPEDGRWAQLRSLKANAKLFAFLQENNISSMAQLHETVASINRDYYDLRGKIVSAERRIADLKQRMEMWSQYERYRPIHEKLAALKPNKREQFSENHHAELALYDAAHRYLGKLKESGEKFTPKKWQAEIAELTRQKDADYVQMRAMREQVKSVEQLRKTAEQLARQTQQSRSKESHLE